MAAFTYRLDENNIICVESTVSVVSPIDGMGAFFFDQMKKYKTNIAQYDVATDEAETHESLLLRSTRTALEMRARGIKEGDIITLNTHNCNDSMVPFIAAQFLGAIVASLDPIIAKADCEYLLSLVQPKLIFCTEHIIDTMAAIKENCKLDADIIVFGKSENHVSFDEFSKPKPNEEQQFEPVKVDSKKTAVIFFSSGTTGLPKGIEVPHTELFQSGQYFKILNFDLTRIVNLASFYWISSVACLVAIMDQGGAQINCRTLPVTEFWGVIQKYKVTYTFLSPTYALTLAKSGRPANIDISCMKNITVAGGPISAENLKTVRDALHECNVTIGYGQTEVGFISSFKSCCEEDIELMKIKGNSAGRPLPGAMYKVVDIETNENQGPNKIGELRIKADFYMNGYYKQDSSSAWDEHGWLRTGDVIYYDEDFCFYIVDRIKELLKYQSWHVTPAKIEGVLLEHPEITEAVVIGVPHAVDGDHPMAVVKKTKDSSLQAEDVVRYVEERVDDRHRLRGGVRFLDDFPYTPTGKVKRKELKQLILSSM